MPTDSWGIDDSYYDALGGFHELSAEAHDRIVRAMHLDPADPPPDQGPDPVRVLRAGEEHWLRDGQLTLESGETLVLSGTAQSLPLGYHRFQPADGPSQTVIVAPRAAYLPEGLRTWGWAVQLYALRSRDSWGIGDLADLQELSSWSRSELGAGMVLINPLAAAMPLPIQEPSPYYPISRLYRNPFYLRPERIPGAGALGVVSQLAEAARELNGERRIDRAAVFRLKMEALESIFAAGIDEDGLRRFSEREGEHLTRFATFCTLAEQFNSGWRAWPEEYRRPEGGAVRRFAEDKAQRIRFHRWLQWQLDEQIGAAAAEIPVMQDLPIGVDPNGADAWAWQDLLAADVSVGAPPDELNAAGQDWGLPPFVPARLRAAGYEPFIRTVRASMRQNGALRIDHVMGLFRLFWIPRGSSAEQGAYVRYRADEMLAILALESERAQAYVCGEDLGTVEPGVREQLAEHNILAYKLFYFEEKTPDTYPRLALASVSTHDLPTIAGLWNGDDLRHQQEIGMSPNLAGFNEMLHRLRINGSFHESTPVEEVIVTTHRQLGKSPAAVTLATLDDALAVLERPNMPGTTTQWPNWSMALPEPLESIEHNPLVRQVGEALNEGRQHQVE